MVVSTLEEVSRVISEFEKDTISNLLHGGWTKALVQKVSAGSKFLYLSIIIIIIIIIMLIGDTVNRQTNISNRT